MITMNTTTTEFKMCSRCRESLPVAQFNRNKAQPDGLQNQCKGCRKIVAAETYDTRRAWRAANAERLKEKQREYYHANPDPQIQRTRARYRANPDLAKKQSAERDRANPAAKTVRGHRYLALKHGCPGTFTAQEWLDLCARHNQRCAMCGEQKPLTVDHIIPRSQKGPNVIANIQPLCLSCNGKKGAGVP